MCVVLTLIAVSRSLVWWWRPVRWCADVIWINSRDWWWWWWQRHCETTTSAVMAHKFKCKIWLLRKRTVVCFSFLNQFSQLNFFVNGWLFFHTKFCGRTGPVHIKSRQKTKICRRSMHEGMSPNRKIVKWIWCRNQNWEHFPTNLFSNFSVRHPYLHGIWISMFLARAEIWVQIGPVQNLARNY